METFIHSLESVAIVFLLTALGYFCAARGWMTANAKKFINQFLTHVGIPVMCVYELSTRLDRAQVLASLPLLAACFLTLFSTLILAALTDRFFLHVERTRKGIFLMMCSTTNSLFIGLAMCTQIYGDSCIPIVMVFYMADTFMIQLVCQPLVRKYGSLQNGKKLSILSILKMPTVIGVLCGFTAVLINLKLPYVLSQTAMYVVRTNTPLALLLTGYIIYDTGLKNLRIDKDQLCVILFRFVVCPAVGIGMTALFGISGLSRSVVTLEAAMPVLSMSVVYASAFGADEKFAAQGAAITTLLSFLAVPALVLLLG